MTADTRPSGETLPELDPRGLFKDAFAIEGIVEADCGWIFFDWALGLPETANPRAMIRALTEEYSDQPRDHPMMIVLREGLEKPVSARPRRSARRRG